MSGRINATSGVISSSNKVALVSSTWLQKSSFTRYYGYVLSLSRKALDEYRIENKIKHDDFLEVMIHLSDEERTIVMSYEEFVKRITQ